MFVTRATKVEPIANKQSEVRKWSKSKKKRGSKKNSHEEADSMTSIIAPEEGVYENMEGGEKEILSSPPKEKTFFEKPHHELSFWQQILRILLPFKLLMRWKKVPDAFYFP